MIPMDYHYSGEQLIPHNTGQHLRTNLMRTLPHKVDGKMLNTLALDLSSTRIPSVHIVEMNRNVSVNYTFQSGLVEHVVAQAIHSGPDPTQDPPPVPNTTEVAVLIVVATIGMIGNFGIIVSILVLHSLRRASNAFLFHQCVLDFIKAAYCLPFAQTMMGHQPAVLCSILGGSYIVFVTTSAFNMLALVMNEAYQFYDLMMSIKDSRNCCCVIFGVFTIWFSSIIMNLGVTVIPGNPSYDRGVDQCVFVYGVTRNYVLHMLWIVLVSMALGCTIFYIRKLHLDIRSSSYYRMTTLVRATVTIDTKVRTASQRRQSQFKEKHHVKHVIQVTKKKLVVLILFVSCYIILWYPLFTLTATDPYMQAPPFVYKILTMLAWSSASMTPFLLFFLIRSGCCCQPDDVPSSILDDTCPISRIEEDQTETLRSTHSTHSSMGTMHSVHSAGGTLESTHSASSTLTRPSITRQQSVQEPLQDQADQDGQAMREFTQSPAKDSFTQFYSAEADNAAGTSKSNGKGTKKKSHKKTKSVSLWI